MSGPAHCGGEPARCGFRPLAGLVLLLLLVRGALVVSLADVFYYGEELEKGAAGKALLDGLGLAHWKLAYHAYEGGGFTISHLDALAFLVCGENLLALKLVALSFNVAILCAGYAFCRRAFGTRAAVFFGLLFVFAPASFQKLSLLALGIHFESLFFALLVLHAATSIAFDGDRRPRTFALLGLAGGFGLFFSYQTVVPLGLAALAVLPAVRGARRATARALASGAIAFAIGFAPWIAMALAAGGEVLDIHGESLLGGERALRAPLAAFFTSIYRGRSALDLAALALLPLATATALCVRRRHVLTPVAWALAFLAVYLVSGFAIGSAYHYFLFERLSPLFGAWLVLVAAGTAAMTSSPARGVRVAGTLVLAALVLSGLRDTLAIVRGGSPGEPGRNVQLLVRTKGYQYTGYLSQLARRVDGDVGQQLATLARFDEPDPGWLDAAIGADVLSAEPDPLAALAAVAPEAARRSALALGLGPGWFDRHGTLARAAETASQAPEDLRDALLEAVGRHGFGRRVTEERLAQELALGLERGLGDAWLRGVGWRLYLVRGAHPRGPYFDHVASPFALDPEAALAFIERAEPSARVALMQGFARAAREHRLDD